MVYTVLTGVLVLTAWWQLGSLRDQIEKSEQASTKQSALLQAEVEQAARANEAQLKALEEARMDSLRPLVVAVSAKSVPFRGAWRISLEVKNVGVGPALDVVASVWISAYEGSERPMDVDRTRSEFDRTFVEPPAARSAPAVLMAGSSSSQPLLRPDEQAGFPSDDGWFWLIVHLEFQDVYRREFWGSPDRPHSFSLLARPPRE